MKSSNDFNDLRDSSDKYITLCINIRENALWGVFLFDLSESVCYYVYMMRNKEMKMNTKIKEGDMITEGGISYVVEKDEEGTLWGVSNNAEYEIELSEDFVPDALFSA